MMLLFLGCIIAALLLVLLLLHWYKITHPTLKERFSTINLFRGKTYAEIQTLVNALPQQTVYRNNGQSVRTWRAGGYSISLLFDDKENCLGVEQEYMGSSSFFTNKQ